ncbi:hypothetical protein FJ418_01390 [Mesorhizobium sp. B2-8-3]|nr:hypothetical protein FJ418_01390 [Mesorhizobium sp. B2-8-3]
MAAYGATRTVLRWTHRSALQHVPQTDSQLSAPFRSKQGNRCIESALPLTRTSFGDADLRRNFPLSSMSNSGPGSFATKTSRARCVSVRNQEEDAVNGIIYLVGLVVIVLFILSFFGLR